MKIKLVILVVAVTIVTLFGFYGRTSVDSLPKLEAEPVDEPDLRIVLGTITGYSSSEDETDGSPYTMASGLIVYDGAIACPRKYEFRTKVIINDKEYECLDRMSERFKDEERFDIWFATKQEALLFGTQELQVTIKETLQ